MAYVATRQKSTRQDTWSVNVTIGGNSFGVWDKKTGGELDSDEVVYYPGAMGTRLSLGGRVLPGNLTLQKLYDVGDIGMSPIGTNKTRLQQMFEAVGKQTVTITQRALDVDGNPYKGGPLVTWNGKLKRVLFPDVDSEGTAAALIEIEVTVEGVPTAS
jgi:hypothetical protein